MSLKDLSLNDLYEALSAIRCKGYTTPLSIYYTMVEVSILEEIKRREKDDRPR